MASLIPYCILGSRSVSRYIEFQTSALEARVTRRATEQELERERHSDEEKSSYCKVRWIERRGKLRESVDDSEIISFLSHGLNSRTLDSFCISHFPPSTFRDEEIAREHLLPRASIKNIFLPVLSEDSDVLLIRQTEREFTKQRGNNGSREVL